ncbi:hypothetical protein O8H67_003192 [Enterobacter asburiae]|nr:hypothetical protein [Enterobacter asburiae]
MNSMIPQAVWFAIAGAFFIKLLELAELHKLPKIERPDLKDWLYWIPYLILPILGGGLAYVYIASNTSLTPLLSVNIGISAPLVLRAMAQIVPATKTPPGA